MLIKFGEEWTFRTNKLYKIFNHYNTTMSTFLITKSLNHLILNRIKMILQVFNKCISSRKYFSGSHIPFVSFIHSRYLFWKCDLIYKTVSINNALSAFICVLLNQFKLVLSVRELNQIQNLFKVDKSYNSFLFAENIKYSH